MSAKPCNTFLFLLLVLPIFSGLLILLEINVSGTMVAYTSACVMFWIEKHFSLGLNLDRVIKIPV